MDRKSAVTEAYKLLQECYQSDANKNRATISAIQGKLSRTTARMDNLVAMRADGEISKEQFQGLRHKAEIEIAALNEELAKLNAVSDEAAQALDMDAIEAALNEVLDFSKPKISESVIDKFVSRITPIDNGHYRWDLNFAPGPKQAIMAALRDVKAKQPSR